MSITDPCVKYINSMGEKICHVLPSDTSALQLAYDRAVAGYVVVIESPVEDRPNVELTPLDVPIRNGDR